MNKPKFKVAEDEDDDKPVEGSFEAFVNMLPWLVLAIICWGVVIWVIVHYGLPWIKAKF